MTLPSEIDKRLRTWFACAIAFMIFGAALIAIGVVATGAIAIFTDDLKDHIKMISFAAAIATGLIAAFNPLSLGSAYLDAWRLLDSAVLHYKAEPGKYEISKVINAVDQGEILIAAASKALFKLPDVVLEAVKQKRDDPQADASERTVP